METIKKEGDYSIVKEGKFYKIYEGDVALETPGGKTVRTQYLIIAERLLADLNNFGYDSYDLPISILSYHFTMLDGFASMEHDAVVEMLNSLNWEKNWTFQSCPSGSPEALMQWMVYFGQGAERIQQVRYWFEAQTHMQLTATTCVYNATMSFNVAFYMASIVEFLPEIDHDKALKEFYNFYSMFDRDYSFDFFSLMFDCFKLYYGIHFKDDGRHLPVFTKSESNG